MKVNRGSYKNEYMRRWCKTCQAGGEDKVIGELFKGEMGKAAYGVKVDKGI